MNDMWHLLDVPGFIKKKTREIREAEIFDCARSLRSKYKKVGAIGFCFGGWAVFRLGAKEHQPPLIDCVSAGHPTWLTEKDVDEVAVPVQILAPEIDPVFTDEMKSYTFMTLQKLRVPFDYQHFPSVGHACFVEATRRR
jgi:dienelactone hydrolase